MTIHHYHLSLLCPDLLQLARHVYEVVGVGLGHKLAHVGLLDKVLVALLVSKADSVLLRLELDAVAVHEVGR